MLDLDFTQEQDMLRSVVRSLCAEHAPLTVVRQLEDDPVGYAPGLWRQLAALDLAGLLVPEEHGGSGMTALEGVVLYEELGRALAPTPHFVSCVAGAGALVAGGTDAQRAAWLPGVASGDVILTPAWLEPDGGFGPAGVRTVARPADGGGWALTGTKRHVAFAAAATRLLVLARTGDGLRDIDLFLVDPQAPGVTLTQQFTVASDAQYRVDLDGVVVDDDARIGGPASGWDTWETVRDDALILLAAWAVGAAGYVQEITVQYAKDRDLLHVSGRPHRPGSQQDQGVVPHRLPRVPPGPRSPDPGVVVDHDARIGDPGSGWDTWETVRDDALILLAAWAVGAAGYVQEITVQYAKDREQFDKPIGAFQAIAHYLADRQTELDGARTLVHEAAWARATGRSVGRLAPMAKLFACRTARQVTATAQQVHGGNGFTVDYDVQLYFRRVKALQLSWWGDRDLEELIAADVLDVPTSGP